MKPLKAIGIIFLIISSHSCQKKKSIKIEFKEYEITYIYKMQSLIEAQFSIERCIKIESKKDKMSLKFDLESDIERLDETRFYQIDSINLNGDKYQNIIWIEDPFAFAIIDLEKMAVLYNSHGEDDIKNRIDAMSKKSCLGKINNKKLISNDCKITF